MILNRDILEMIIIFVVINILRGKKGTCIYFQNSINRRWKGGKNIPCKSICEKLIYKELPSYYWNGTVISQFNNR
ncbi:MAG: hypothetical protein HeimC2_11980 [Candidatus Heimdallarchaeota archaeon LC_2]|nr:MAG: hypothetical protein HeimC2_11980 [Candidatus Heimdallarchaeota archaeon LC_2]